MKVLPCSYGQAAIFHDIPVTFYGSNRLAFFHPLFTSRQHYPSHRQDPSETTAFLSTVHILIQHTTHHVVKSINTYPTHRPLDYPSATITSVYVKPPRKQLPRRKKSRHPNKRSIHPNGRKLELVAFDRQTTTCPNCLFKRRLLGAQRYTSIIPQNTRLKSPNHCHPCWSQECLLQSFRSPAANAIQWCGNPSLYLFLLMRNGKTVLIPGEMEQ